MKTYTVSQLAKIAGVSVRTLHHYDHIDLLAPTARSAAGYRLYQQDDLLRLQQILFFRELGLALGDIREILDDPHFDQVAALQEHQRLLRAEMGRLACLVGTVEKTIERLTEDDEMRKMTDEELYEGFTKDQVERYEREVKEKYDPALVAESKRRLGKMSRAQWDAVKQDGDQVTRAVAALTGRAPGDAEVQALMAQHHAWIENFYPCSAEVYRGLGQLYAEHAEFRANYERYGPNLADFMCAAMAHYAGHVLDKRPE